MESATGEEREEEEELDDDDDEEEDEEEEEDAILENGLQRSSVVVDSITQKQPIGAYGQRLKYYMNTICLCHLTVYSEGAPSLRTSWAQPCVGVAASMAVEALTNVLISSRAVGSITSLHPFRTYLSLSLSHCT